MILIFDFWGFSLFNIFISDLEDVMQHSLINLQVTLSWGGEGKSHLGVRAAIHRGQDRLEEQANGNFTKFSGDKGKVHNPWQQYRLGRAGLGSREGAGVQGAAHVPAAGLQAIHQGLGLSPCSQHSGEHI